MELVVGKNTYFDVDEADEIISSRFRKNSIERKTWDDLGDEKSIVILYTTEKYDNSNMLYKGSKKDSKQNLQFPRIINNEEVNCPESIKVGLILQCLRDLIAENSEEEQLLKKGVTKYKIKEAEIDLNNTLYKEKKNLLGIDKDIWSRYFEKYSNLGKYIPI